jgi:glycerol uptake facilitator-like aquaporin
VTVGRIFTDSFAGIGALSVPSFVIAQLLGAALGIVLAKVFAKSKK